MDFNSLAKSSNFDKKNCILRPEVLNFSMPGNIQSPGRQMIVATRVELSLPTRKFRAEVRYISILRPEAGTFANRIACSDQKFRICLRQIIFHLLAGA